MARYDSKKSILLEKTYLYVRASLGFQLEGTSTEKIPTNNGFYRFFVDNLQKAIGNSYVNVIYDSSDLSFQCFCSDLYMDELMSSDSSAIEDVVEELKKSNSTILEFENGVSSGLSSNHEDNVVISENVLSFHKDFLGAFSGNLNLSPFPLVEKDYSSLCHGGISLHVSDFINKFTHQIYISKRVVYSSRYHVDCFSNLTNTNDQLKFDINVCNKFNSFTFVNSGKHYPYGYGTFSFIKDGVLDHRYLVGLGSNAYQDDMWFSFSVNRVAPCVAVGFDFEITIDEYFFNVLCFLDDTFKYGSSCFINNTLTLYGDVCKSACLNQNFNYDFSGGYLGFSFFSTLGIDFLKSFNYTFITDAGEFSFSGNSLGLKYVEGTNFVVSENFPNLVSPVSLNIRKLLGVRVGLDSYRLPSMGTV